MKWILSALLLLPFLAFGQTPFKGTDYMFYYQVNVGKTNGTLTTPSAWLEIGKDSTTKALRMPRAVDTANISSPVFGLVLYQIKDNGIYFRDKFGWRRLSDATILNNYLLKSDSTTFYYPLKSNPKNYVITEQDPSANAKTIRWIPGAGIRVSNSSPQALSTNPSDSIVAKVDSAIWNANRLQSAAISATPPTSGQILQYNGSQYIPVTFSGGGGGSVTSVGLSLPSIFTVTNSPVITSGTLTGTLNNQTANLIFASPNGTSGVPTFRGLANGDLPNSPISPGLYGDSSNVPQLSINSKGIITNASTKPIVYPQRSLQQVTNFGNITSNNIVLTGTSPDPSDLVFSDNLGVEYARVYADPTGLQLSAGPTPIPAKISILSSGNIGIGKINPAEKLEVNGNIIAASPSYSSGGILPIGRNQTTGRFETIVTSGSSVTLKTYNTNATGADTLYAYTVPSVYLANSGDIVKTTYAGTFAATGATAHTVGIAAGGTVIASLSNGTTSGGSWEIETTIVRVNNTTIRGTTKIVLDNTGVTTSLYLHTTSEVTGLNLSVSGLRLGLAIGSPNTNVTATMGTVIYYPGLP